MTNPVQVIAEAPCLTYPLSKCVDRNERVHPQCVVAALKAAGALMPDEFTSVDQQAGFVIADAICGHGQPEINLPAPCDDCRDVAEAASGALGAKGLLLGFAARVEVVRLVTQATKRDALLQEALSVLGRRTHKRIYVYGGAECSCGQLWPCPEASLAENIEKAIGGEG